MRRRGQQLSAITGPARLEYVLPAAVADKIGGTKNYAYCVTDADDMVKAARIIASNAQAKESFASRRKAAVEVALESSGEGYMRDIRERLLKKEAAKAKREAKSGNVFADLAAQVQSEIDKLRAKGVTGPIPVCVTRSSGKRGSELPRFFRRANATHERFHADARRLDADAGFEKYSCYKRLDALTDPYIGGTPLRYFSLRNYADMKPKLATEELLARVEEVRLACERKKGQKAGDCEPTLVGVIKYMPKPEAEAFVALVKGIRRDFGTPLNVVRAAVRSCKVP